MGLLDKFKEIITENDDDFDDYYDDDNRDYGLAAPERAERQERPRHERAPKPERQERPRSRGRDDKVVNIHTTTQLQVVLVKPERFEEAASIGDNLNAKRTVVLNLESTNRDIARRLLDFLRRGVCQQRPDQAGSQQHLYHYALQCRCNGRSDR